MQPPDEAETAEMRAVYAAILGAGALVSLVAAGGILLAGDGRAAAGMTALAAGFAVVAAWSYRRWRRYRAAERAWFEQRWER